MARIRHVIAMQNEGNLAHPFTGKRTVYHNAETAHVAAHPEWATKYPTAAAARAVVRTLPQRDGGYELHKVVV